MLFNRLRYFSAAAFMVLAFTSCDDDFNSIGGEIVGGQLDALPRYEAGVVAYNKRIEAVQTNNLPAHLLGVYKEPVFGLQTASVLTQLTLSAASPNFGEEPTIDSVVLTLPYFTERLENNAAGDAVYRLDSVYGNSPFKLSVSRSGYYLNDFDPDANFETRQRYYSDQEEIIENNLVGSPIFVMESFRPSNREVSYRQRNEAGVFDTVQVSPRMRVQLPVAFFQENIINKAGSTELSSNNNFKNYLRGLYFKAEAIDQDGSMLLVDFSNSNAGIMIYYTNTVEQDGEETEEQNTFNLTFGANTVNIFSQEFPANISQEIAASNDSPGAANLFLKGGAGSMAVIELFEDEAELEEIRSNNWLINEANLTFYVNRERIPGGSTEPDRIFLYNLDNNTILSDYGSDPTAGTEDPNNSVLSHLPALVRDEDERGTHYKLRITEHIRRVLNGDIDNVRLGLVVTQNVNIISNSAVRPVTNGVSRVPVGSVITPEGTVLHGNLSPDEEKRLKFNIIYTQTNN